MKKIFQELKRRNVYKETLAYLVGAWLILQVASVILSAFETPSWVLKVVIAFLGLGLPFWIFFSWTYQVTENGIEKTPSTKTVDQSKNSTVNKKLNISIAIGLVLIGTLTFIALKQNSAESIDNTDQIAIAVLPFENLSPDDDNEWWGDAFTEDILTYLSGINEIKVISRKSVRQYKDSDKTVPQIAMELGVNHIVEGSVRKLEDEILVTAQLINAQDDHIWASNYKEKVEDVFTLQQRISKSIVNELQLQLAPEEEISGKKPVTTNTEAYKLFNKGLEVAEQRSEVRLDKAQQLFSQAIALDSNYVDAYAKNAEMELLKISYNYSDDIEESLKLVQKNISTGLALDSTNVRVLNSLAYLYANEGDTKKAIRILHKALRINPNHIRALDLLALYYAAEGSLEKQYEYLGKAVELNPLDPRTVYMYIHVLSSLDLPVQAQNIYDANSFLFEADLVDTRGVIASVLHKDFTHLIDSLETKLEVDPNYRRARATLAQHTWVIERNRAKELYAKKWMYENYPKFWIRQYALALIKQHKPAVLDSILKASNQYLTERGRNYIQAVQSYTNKDWATTVQYLDSVIRVPRKRRQFDPNNINSFRLKACALAKLNRKSEAISLMDSIFGTNTNYNFHKASVFAVMKEKDSMYYYLENKKYREPIANFRFEEFDPYFKETRFQEILRRNYLPVENYLNSLN